MNSLEQNEESFLTLWRYQPRAWCAKMVQYTPASLLSPSTASAPLPAPPPSPAAA